MNYLNIVSVPTLMAPYRGWIVSSVVPPKYSALLKVSLP
jgi:hypothetical protein